MEIKSSNQVWTSVNNTLVELMKVNQEQANIAAQGSIVAAMTARYSTIALSGVSTLDGRSEQRCCNFNGISSRH